jgi:hypothetical protein
MLMCGPPGLSQDVSCPSRRVPERKKGLRFQTDWGGTLIFRGERFNILAHPSDALLRPFHNLRVVFLESIF